MTAEQIPCRPDGVVLDKAPRQHEQLQREHEFQVLLPVGPVEQNADAAAGLLLHLGRRQHHRRHRGNLPEHLEHRVRLAEDNHLVQDVPRLHAHGARVVELIRVDARDHVCHGRQEVDAERKRDHRDLDPIAHPEPEHEHERQTDEAEEAELRQEFNDRTDAGQRAEVRERETDSQHEPIRLEAGHEAAPEVQEQVVIRDQLLERQHLVVGTRKQRRRVLGPEREDEHQVAPDEHVPRQAGRFSKRRERRAKFFAETEALVHEATPCCHSVWVALSS